VAEVADILVSSSAVFIMAMLVVSLALAFATSTIRDSLSFASVLSKANERVKVFAISTGDKTFYSMRNLGTGIVVVKEYGLVGAGGAVTRVAANIQLRPGEARVFSFPGSYISAYAITSQNVVSSSAVMHLQSRSFTYNIYSPAPSSISLGLGTLYIDRPVDIATTFSLEGYAFAFILARQPRSTNSLYYLKMVPMEEVQKALEQISGAGRGGGPPIDPIYQYPVIVSSGPVSAYGSFDMFALADAGTGRPGYVAALAVEIRNSAGDGLVLAACVGFALMTVNPYVRSSSLQSPPIFYDTMVRGQDSYSTLLAVLIAPPASDTPQFIEYLTRATPSTAVLSSGAGSLYSIAVARCVKIESTSVSSIDTINPNHKYFDNLPGGFRVCLSIAFPGSNSNCGRSGGTTSIPYITVSSQVDMEQLAYFILNYLS